MTTTNVEPGQVPGKVSFLTMLFRKLQKKASGMFEPEEVEVTFEEDQGKIVRYTYTKVSHKQVA